MEIWAEKIAELTEFSGFLDFVKNTVWKEIQGIKG